MPRPLGPLFELAGQPEPAIPGGLGRDRLRLASGITLSETGSLHLRDTVATLDDNRLELEVDLIPGEAARSCVAMSTSAVLARKTARRRRGRRRRRVPSTGDGVRLVRCPDRHRAALCARHRSDRDRGSGHSFGRGPGGAHRQDRNRGWPVRLGSRLCVGVWRGRGRTARGQWGAARFRRAPISS